MTQLPYMAALLAAVGFLLMSWGCLRLVKPRRRRARARSHAAGEERYRKLK